MLIHFIQKRFVFVLCASVVLFAFSFQHKAGNTIITGDGVGYYSYLPALFIYHDADYKFLSVFRENYQPVHEFIREAHGEKVNQYFVGEAVLLLPFFLLSHEAAVLAALPVDGFSMPYQIGVLLGSLFYFCWAIWLLSLVFKRFSEQTSHRIIVLLAMVWGTNLLMYATLYASYSHVFSFWAFSVFFYGLVGIHESSVVSNWLKASAGIAFVALIRPSNLVVVLTVPFFMRECATLNFINRNYRSILFAMLLFVAIISLQPMVWYWQTYHWWVDAYTTAKFEFDNPHIAQVLFSYQKGWWVYTPIALFSLFGLFRVFCLKYLGKYLLTFFIVLNIYVISSWSYWHYGATFGQRPFVESYGIHGLLLLVGLGGLTKGYWQTGAYLFISIFIFLNIFQTIQYRMNIIHPSNMTKEVYWKVFLRTGEKYRFLADKVSKPCTECSLTDSLGNWQHPVPNQLYEVQIPNAEKRQMRCLLLTGKLKSKLHNTDAYLQVELFEKDNLIGTEKVFMLRYLNESEVSPVYHDIVLRNTLQKATRLRFTLHQWENGLIIEKFRVALQHTP